MFSLSCCICNRFLPVLSSYSSLLFMYASLLSCLFSCLFANVYLNYFFLSFDCLPIFPTVCVYLCIRRPFPLPFPSSLMFPYVSLAKHINFLSAFPFLSTYPSGNLLPFLPSQSSACRSFSPLFVFVAFPTPGVAMHPSRSLPLCPCIPRHHFWLAGRGSRGD